jgi:hypothetical protein
MSLLWILLASQWFRDTVSLKVMWATLCSLLYWKLAFISIQKYEIQPHGQIKFLEGEKESSASIFKHLQPVRMPRYTYNDPLSCFRKWNRCASCFICIDQTNISTLHQDLAVSVTIFWEEIKLWEENEAVYSHWNSLKHGICFEKMFCSHSGGELSHLYWSHKHHYTAPGS